MGTPGWADVEIKTELSETSHTATRTIALLDGIGLNSLSMYFSFEDDKPDIFLRKIFRDLSMLEDGKYRITRKIRPENFLDFEKNPTFDYVWIPIEKGEESRL